MTNTHGYHLGFESNRPTAIHVAPALHPILSGTVDEWRNHGLHLVFMDDYESTAATPGTVVLVPAFTPSQAAALTKLVDSHPLAIVIGVVRDATGLQTHTAIAAGASYVANLHLSWSLLLVALAPAIASARRTTSCSASQSGDPALFTTDVVPPDSFDGDPRMTQSSPPSRLNPHNPAETRAYHRIQVLSACNP